MVAFLLGAFDRSRSITSRIDLSTTRRYTFVPVYSVSTGSPQNSTQRPGPNFLFELVRIGTGWPAASITASDFILTLDQSMPAAIRSSKLIRYSPAVSTLTAAELPAPTALLFSICLTERMVLAAAAPTAVLRFCSAMSSAFAALSAAPASACEVLQSTSIGAGTLPTVLPTR